MAVDDSFDNYLTTIDGTECYIAGLPGYPRNFSRDAIIAGIIAADHKLLDNQLQISCEHQGKNFDTMTGEEPGKIHHEYPGVVVHAPYLTTYDACDTSALYLIGLEILQRLNRRESQDFLDQHGASVELALKYLKHHIRDNIFWEFPPPGAKHFSLHTTYWKDSSLPAARGREEPAYPVSFALAHFQAARGMLAAARILGREDLASRSDAMFKKGIKTYITEDHFCLERDDRGCLNQISSDELHSLAYIPAEYAADLPLEAIRRRAMPLITPAGIACTPREVSEKMADTYHGYVVWIFEQALIHYACNKFGLEDIASATLGCTSYVDAGQELLSITPEIKPLGNGRQLWSVAAKTYFSDKPSLRQASWL